MAVSELSLELRELFIKALTYHQEERVRVKEKQAIEEEYAIRKLRAQIKVRQKQQTAKELLRTKSAADRVQKAISVYRAEGASRKFLALLKQIRLDTKKQKLTPKVRLKSDPVDRAELNLEDIRREAAREIAKIKENKPKLSLQEIRLEHIRELKKAHAEAVRVLTESHKEALDMAGLLASFTPAITQATNTSHATKKRRKGKQR